MTVLAATWVDGAVLAGLVVFVVWGCVAGALRQALGLAALLAAFVVAGIAAPRLEEPAARFLGPSSPGEASCLAWCAAFAATVVAGAFVISVLRRALDQAPRAWLFDRAAGGAVGAVKGVIVLAVFAYALLGARGGARPSEAVRGSVSARVLRGFEARVAPWAGLPAGVQSRVDAANASLAPGSPP